jgi:hypothetical protein
MKEADSLCTSTLHDFYQDHRGVTFDSKLFEAPMWPKQQWALSLYGEKFTYMNDGKTAKAMWQGNRKIDCDGDLAHHGELDLGFTCDLTDANSFKI